MYCVSRVVFEIAADGTDISCLENKKSGRRTKFDFNGRTWNLPLDIIEYDDVSQDHRHKIDQAMAICPLQSLSPFQAGQVIL